MIHLAEEDMMMKTGSFVGFIGGAVLGALVAAAPATAADMAPAYKAAPMPAPAYNWSGFYVGVTAGGGMASMPVTDMDDFEFFSNSQALKSAGAVAGVHAGYNWQFAPSFLVGIEGDFNWSSFKESDTTCRSDCTTTDDRLIASSKLDSFGTLVYVTAGPAWGHINSSLTAADCLNTHNGCDGLPFARASDSSFHVGVALGAGVEYAITQNWIFRGEYMHLDFTNKDAAFTDTRTQLAIPGFRARSTATADIARVGISYKVW
jgi:outer membrane immunogenic protein